MKFFTAILAIAGISSALVADKPSPAKRDAPSIVERDYPTISAALVKVDNAINNLDSAVVAYNGNIQPVIAAGENLISTFKSGTTTIQGTSSVGNGDALRINQQLKTIGNDTTKLKNDIIAKRSVIIAHSQCANIRTELVNIKNGFQNFCSAIVGKVPPDAQMLTQKNCNDILQVFTDTNTAYTTTNCPR